MSRFNGRVALVTGAASGIGKATAERPAPEGAAGAVVDRREEGARETGARRRAAGGRAVGYTRNAAGSAEVAALADAVGAELGPVDILANVAGIGDTAGLETIAALDDGRWHAVLAVNLSGPFFLCRAVIPSMVARGHGAIVNVSSLAGRSKSALGGLASSTGKAGLLGLTRHLAFDYGPHGIRVNAICPGPVDTPMLRAGGVAAARSSAEEAARRERLAAYQYFMPIKRISTAAEQAAAIAVLAFHEGSHTNGVAPHPQDGPC